MTSVESSASLHQTVAPATTRQFRPFGDDGFSFADFIDIINPLQHLPVVSTLYRRVTGDALEPGPRVLGGTLFGGPLGAVASVVNAIVEAESGKDVGEHVATALLGEPDNPIYVAAAETVPAPSAVSDEVRAALAIRAVEERPLPDLTQVADIAPWTPSVELESPRGDRRQAGGPAAPPDRVATTRPVPDGATAEAGGWFSETMLSALRKYEDAVAAARAQGSSVQRTI